MGATSPPPDSETHTDDPDVKTVISCIIQNLAWTNSHTAAATVTQYADGDVFDGPRIITTAASLLHFNNRHKPPTLEWKTERYTVQEGTDPEFKALVHYLNDGQSLITFKRFPTVPQPELTLAPPTTDEVLSRMRASFSGGYWADGYLYANNSRSLADIAMGIARSTPERITVATKGSIVTLAFSSAYGYITISADANADYVITSYSVHKNASDTFKDMRLDQIRGGQAGRITLRWECSYQATNVQSFNNYTIATEGVLATKEFDSLDQWTEQHLTITRQIDRVSASSSPVSSRSELLDGGSRVVNLLGHGLLLEAGGGTLQPWYNRDNIVAIQHLMSASATGSATPAAPSRRMSPVSEWDAYCGLYSLYAYLVARKSHIDFESLLRPEFISSPVGSSIEDLVLACEQLGIDGSVFVGFNLRSVDCAPTPSIALVRPDLRIAEYSHFILLLEHTQEGVIAFFPPTASHSTGIRTLSYSELAHIWAGAGILFADVSNSGGHAWISHAYSIGRLFLALCFMFVGLWLVGLTHDTLRSAGDMLSNLMMCIMLVAVAGGGAWLYFTIVPETPLRDFAFYEKVVVANRPGSPTYARTIQADEAQTLLNVVGVVFVDAREQKDFEQLAIPGAVNITWNTKALSQVNSRVLHDASKIIIYCNPYSCPLSSVLANFLDDDPSLAGKLFVIEGDWTAWREVKQQ